MIRFLTIVLSIYCGMHALVYYRIRVLIPDRRVVQILFILFLILMITAPIVSRILERNGNEMLARYTAVIGFYWLGFVFLAFFGAFIMQFIDIFLRGINHFTRLSIPYLSGRVPNLFLIGIVTVACIYGFFEARDIKTERITIVTGKLPPGTDRLKIVQISDVHLGMLTGRRLIQKITEKIHLEKPDILVSTGDFIDGISGITPENSYLFKRITPRYGKYAVTGNHEYYTGLESSLGFTSDSGFRILRGEVSSIEGIINIAGVDDPAVNAPKPENLLASAGENGLFTILLKHRPIVSKAHLGLFDLQLSGHTHGGQIFPFKYLVAMQYPLPVGFIELSKGSRLYTSRGTGTWGPQIRIFSPPEITVIELNRKIETISRDK